MKKLFKAFSLISISLVIMLTFASCGASKNMGDAGYSGDSFSKEEANIIENSNAKDDSSVRKIIETIDISVQTKNFDDLMQNINNQISALGGYVESSNVSGREYDSDNTRYATMKIRIPSEKSGDFNSFISENSVVVNRTITTDDVTLKYVDMESRVKVLEAEKEALENILKGATTVSDIVTIREQLTDVIADIESYKSQLRTYDNLIDYSTITIRINEVKRTVPNGSLNVWQKIGTNLVNGFINVWNGAVNLFVFVVSAIPYLIPFAIIGGGVLVIVKLSKKKNK